jgi:hypothetical protein
MSIPNIQTLSFLCKNTNLTVHNAISLENLKDLFHLPLSQEAFLELEELEVICGNTMQMIQE